MENYRFDGIGKACGGEYNQVKINGIGNCDGHIKAETIDIDGIFTCEGSIETKILNCDGLATFKSTIQTENLKVDGKFKCSGDTKATTLNCDGLAHFGGNLSCKNILVDGSIKVDGEKVEATEIICGGIIRTEGQISADIIEAEGCINAREIVGDKIKIKSNTNFLARIFKKYISVIELIEATSIDISGVRAINVNGENVNIGPGCEIENLDCSGILNIDKTSIVKTITGKYALS